MAGGPGIGDTWLLGAVLAGGRSSRFGSDKALALIGGVRLLDHAVAALASQCAAVVVIGRDDPHHDCAPDQPRPDLGPLGGLAGALSVAEQRGFDAVLSCSVDNVTLPPGLAALLAPGPALVAAQPTVGLWPVATLPALLDFIDSDPKRSLRGFSNHVGARMIEAPHAIANINRPIDLERFRDRLD